MKKKILLFTFLFAITVASQAADIYYYQTKFSADIDTFKLGLKSKAAFDKLLVSLDEMQKGLASETAIAKKEPLLSDIQSVYAFVGEIAPDSKSYSLGLSQKANAMTLLGVTEEATNDSSICLPITRIKLWDKYTCYLVSNKSDSMMVKYKFNFVILGKYSSSKGFVDAGVSKKCARSIFESFNDVKVKFTQEKCSKESQVVKYIQPEVIQPKVEVYPDPDYLSPQQKQAFKKKEKEKLKKEKEKQKKTALKEKDKKKKDLEKLKNEKKKEANDSRDAKLKELQTKKEAATEKTPEKKEDKKKK